MKKYIECGKIVSTHGIKGEVKIQPWTDDAEHLLKFDSFYLEANGKALAVDSSRVHKNMLMVKFKGISSMDEANEYRGKVLYINREEDPDDRPYLQDYIGVKVTDIDTGADYGKIVDVIVTGANDVYDLKDDNGRQRLVPDIPQVVLETDLVAREMKIRPLKGLFDDED